MPNIYDDVVEVARRTMVLFFVVAIEDVIPEIKDISENNADAQIKIAVLEFSDGAKWITPKPVPAEDFHWDYLNASGLTDFGDACSCLNEKLSRNAFMSEITGSFAPAIFLLSDGEPTDDFIDRLDDLWKNNWFRKAIKVAVAIGDDANTEVLADFTGDSDADLSVHSPEALRKMVKFVSVTSSQIGSKSSMVRQSSVDSAPSKQEDFLEQVKIAFSSGDFTDDEVLW